MANFALFGLAPTVLYWVWYLGQGRDGIPDDYHFLKIAAPLSGLWISLAPLVFQQGEFIYEELLDALSTDETEAGWDIPAIQSSIDRIDRHYALISRSLALPIAISVGYVLHGIRDIAPVDWPAGLLGESVILIFVGHISATGIWGIVKVLAILHSAVTHSTPQWRPFRAPYGGFQSLFRFAWLNGVNFSLSNFTVPALIAVWPRLHDTTRSISATFIALTSIGGLLTFWLTTVWLNRTSRRMQTEAVEALAPAIETLSTRLVRIDRLSAQEAVHLRHSLDALLMLRQQLLHEDPAPRIRTAFRASTTVVLPVVLIFVQFLLQRIFS
ncbi:hypothetical protein [Frankia gtarii]|uniref:hypothetical protein n=1 Tax=Frankia gtarii TaxID=2950102 RepID=UPI0021C177CD|nr:hypothetical protein [Frankia gtarii]